MINKNYFSKDMSLKGEVLPYILKQQISRRNKIVGKELKMKDILSPHDDDCNEEDKETHG